MRGQGRDHQRTMRRQPGDNGGTTRGQLRRKPPEHIKKSPENNENIKGTTKGQQGDHQRTRRKQPEVNMETNKNNEGAAEDNEGTTRGQAGSHQRATRRSLKTIRGAPEDKEEDT